MKVIPSTEEQRAFVRDVASRGGEVDIEAANAEDDWGFEGMVSSDELVASGVRGKRKEIQCICEEEK